MHITKSKSKRKFSQHSLICTRVTILRSCYMRNHSFFSESDVRNFFMYIIISKILTNLNCSGRNGEYWPSVVYVRTLAC